ncbi:MAG: SDR family oxidoreductase [Bacteroidales bacterium]|nr:SDR family oxidoreductase [Bacteroidales bacterium]
MKDVCVVTGGGGGMAVALEELIGKDYDLLVTARTQEKVDKLVADLAAKGIEAEGFVCEVQNRDQVKALAARAKEKGTVKAVVNTAGVSPSMVDDLRIILETNLLGTYYVTEEFYDVIAPGGALLNLSSTGGVSYGPLVPKADGIDGIIDKPEADGFIERLVGICEDTEKMFAGALSAGWVAYGISKYFVIRYSQRNAFRFYRNKGVRVNSISPGNFETKMGAIERENGGAQQQAICPIERYGDPKEIAEVMAFMISEKAGYVCGENWLVDGGAMAGLTIPQIQ